MSDTNGYDFKAPQFVASLSTVEMDDGADDFFDAADNIRKSNEQINALADKKDELKSAMDNAVMVPINSNADSKSLHEEKISDAQINNIADKKDELKAIMDNSVKVVTGTAANLKSSKDEKMPIFKANKVPKIQISKTPAKPAPRPTTVPKPFNLTEPGKLRKVQQTDNPLEGSSNSAKSPRKPVNVKKMFLEIEDGKLVMKEKWGLTGLIAVNNPNKKTKVVPFSFEKREQERLKAKQAKLDDAKENNHNNFKSATPKSAQKSRPNSRKST